MTALCNPSRSYRFSHEVPCTECEVVNDLLLGRGVTMDESLLSGLAHHPQGWEPRDIAALPVAIDNGSDEPSFTWVLQLVDGRWAAVRGWHDYTGWDCQSGLRTEWYATEDDAMRTLVDWERDAVDAARAKASGTPPAPPVAHETATGGEAVPGGGGVPGGAAAP